MPPPPDLPYAPKRKRPLSLWNPLDYLQLLYWVFYFPQALRWYVETFGSLPYDTNGWEALRHDPVQRRLALQGLLLTLTVPFAVAFALRYFDVEVDMRAVALGVALGLTWGVAAGVAWGIATGLALSVAWGLTWGIAAGVVAGLALSLVAGLALSLALGIATGITVGVVRGIAAGVVRGVALGLSAGVVLGLSAGIALGRSFGLTAGVTLGLAAGVALGLAILRPEMLLFSFPLTAFPSSRFAIILQRVSPVPLLGLRRRLSHRLFDDWTRGVHECEGLLRYSLQFVAVVAAISDTLGRFPPHFLLSRVASWCSQPLYDWQVVCFQFAELRTALREAFWNDFFIVPRRWQPQIEVSERYDTPARAACAGFWLWHVGKTKEASAAFALVRTLPHGEELYRNAEALAAAMDCESLGQLAVWQPPDSGKSEGEPLRPQVQALFVELSWVAWEIETVQRSRSPRQRSSALNRATGLLNVLPAQLTNCPTPERDLFATIFERWLRIVLASATAVGTLAVREPVASPYIVGALVPAERLVGRQDIFEKISAAWMKPGPRDSLVIFGHRRMGKSSVARNVAHFCRLGEDTGLAVLSLQSVDWSQGLSDLCYAIALQLWQATPNSPVEPRHEDYEHHPITMLRQFLAALGRQSPPRRYILILDEYELLDKELPEKVANDFSTLLRGFSQDFPWLAMGLVGLHTLEERSSSFSQAIYAWRPIRVGLMDRDAVAEVLQVQDDAFPLEYSLDAVERVHALTGGQPFLVQLLGESLVQRFNRRLRQDLEPPAPTFTAADVDAAVADPEFYQSGSPYFRGIWDQAGEAPLGQIAILQALAPRRTSRYFGAEYFKALPIVPHGNGRQRDKLQSASGLEPPVFDAALDALKRHDVVEEIDGVCRYTVELMRRWVEAGEEKR